MENKEYFARVSELFERKNQKEQKTISGKKVSPETMFRKTFPEQIKLKNVQRKFPEWHS